MASNADPNRDQTVNNDAVAGETVYPGPGDGNNGPTGGAEREIEPMLDEHDDEEATEDISDVESIGDSDVNDD